jgi:uncharacterized protein
MPNPPIRQLNESSWQSLRTDHIPFLSYEFFKALNDCKVIGESSGWEPIYFQKENSLLFSFIKTHSYGEYIFDWDWARAYERHGFSYYPKLTSMIPFTSVTTKHFIGECSSTLMKSYEKFYLEGPYSSSHFLFLDHSEIEFFKSFNYMIRDSFQYHFFNQNYEVFDDFLGKLKPKKGKQIRKERNFDDSFSFHRYTGKDLCEIHASQMYQFYLSTISSKGSISYLNEDFFKEIFKALKDQILYVEACRNAVPIAGALYFFSSKRLYGRYWGAVENHANLHFELCYYQGIEFLLEKKLEVFEAGAQGEHKIPRGFRPVKTYSAHKIKDPSFSKAIQTYIDNERQEIDRLLPELSKMLPFKEIL